MTCGVFWLKPPYVSALLTISPERSAEDVTPLCVCDTLISVLRSGWCLLCTGSDHFQLKAFLCPNTCSVCFLHIQPRVTRQHGCFINTPLHHSFGIIIYSVNYICICYFSPARSLFSLSLCRYLCFPFTDLLPFLLLLLVLLACVSSDV